MSSRTGAPVLPRPAAVLLLLLIAAGGAAAAAPPAKKFKPPASLSAAPVTVKVGNLRAAATVVSKAWKAQVRG